MLTSTNSPRRLAAALGAAALLATLPVAAAATTTGAVSGIGAQFFFSDGWHTTAATEVNYGRSDDEFFIGDWDGDGVDTLAVRRGTRFHVSNGFSGGRADTVLDYGRLGDTVLVGDWDGDGADTFAVRRGNVYHLRNTLTGGPQTTANYPGVTVERKSGVLRTPAGHAVDDDSSRGNLTMSREETSQVVISR